MRLALLLVVIGILTGCASSPVKFADYSKRTEVDDQRIGELQTRKMGEVLAAKGVRTLVPALRLTKATVFNKAEGQSSIMTCAVTALAGTYPQRGDYKGKPAGLPCYGPVSIQITLADGTTNWNCPGQDWLADICESAPGKYFVALNAAKAELKQQFDNVKLISIPVEGSTNLVQDLVYDGRSGDVVNLTYREFTTDVARPSFAQGLQVDMGRTKRLKYRTLELEIVDANDLEITYKVVSGFQGQ